MNVLRIARNHLEDQRWAGVALTLYALGMTVLLGLAGGNPSREDLLFFVHQQGSFAVLLSLLLAGAALNSDLRSRRILGTLAAPVRRSEYLGGIAVACWSMALIYLFVIVSAAAVLTRMSPVMREVFPMLQPAAVLALLSVTTALMFATFMHPLFATAVAGIVLSAPGPIAAALHLNTTWISPSYKLGRAIVGISTPDRPIMCLSGLVHTLATFAIAVAIFARRDIAAPTD